MGEIESLYSAVEYTNRHLRHIIGALKQDHIQNARIFHDNKLRPEWCAICIVLDVTAEANNGLIAQLMKERKSL